MEPSHDFSEVMALLRRARLTAREQEPPPQSLTEASGRGDLEAMRAFLEAGSDVEERSFGFDSPLVAAASGELAAVELLLAHGARACPKDAVVLPIQAAAGKGKLAIVRRLLEAGTPSEACEPAVIAALLAGQLATVRFLMDAGVVLSERSRAQVLGAARALGETHVVRFLEGAPLDPLEDGDRPDPMGALRASIEEAVGSPPAVDAGTRAALLTQAVEIIGSGRIDAQIDARDPAGSDTLLLVACENRQVDVVRALIARGADVGLPTEQTRFTPLMVAARVGCTGAVKLLLAAGADPNARSDIRYTALIEAAKWGDPELVQVLLDAGADPKARSEGGESPMVSARGLHAERIRALLNEAMARRAGPSRSRKPEGAIRYAKARKAIDPATARGVRDFVAFWMQGHPEWAVLCVKAPAADVAAALVDLHEGGTVERDVHARSVKPFERQAFVFQLAGSTWSAVIRRLGDLTSEDIEALPREGRALSRALATRVLTFWAEDTSSALGYGLFEGGEDVESAEWEWGDGELRFHSTRRAAPARFKGDASLADEVFRDEGAYLPPCHLETDGFELLLKMRGMPPGAVASAHLVHW